MTIQGRVNQVKQLKKLKAERRERRAKARKLRLLRDFEAPSLEVMFSSPEFAGVEGASPLQRAICRAARGEDTEDVLGLPEAEKHLGGRPPEGWVPSLIVLISGVRAGKSWIASTAAIHASLSVEFRQGRHKLRRHELPRFPIIGPTKDAATATFNILKGIIENSPVLSVMVDGEPTADTIWLRRPDGYRVEICVVAASRGGTTVRNRWLAGFIIEEVAQIGEDSSGAAVNTKELVRAAEPRLLTGCQGWLISSPFGPTGQLYELWKRYFGVIPNNRALVVWAPTRAMNPTIDRDRIEELRLEDPDAVAREYDAEWVDADVQWFATVLIERAMREAPLCRPRPPGAICCAAMDPATRGNGWTLAVACADQVDGAKGPTPGVAVLGCWEWVGSQQFPLSPKAVFEEIAAILEPYDVNVIRCDQWAFDAIQDHAHTAGLALELVPPAQMKGSFGRLKALASSSQLELPPDQTVKGDLQAIRKVGNASGVNIVLPKQANGRHCDYAVSVALVVADAAEYVQQEENDEPGVNQPGDIAKDEPRGYY